MPDNEASQMWGSDLGLFYSSLFNFYQYAAFEVKRKFLEFVKEYVLRLQIAMWETSFMQGLQSGY